MSLDSLITKVETEIKDTDTKSMVLKLIVESYDLGISEGMKMGLRLMMTMTEMAGKLAFGGGKEKPVDTTNYM